MRHRADYFAAKGCVVVANCGVTTDQNMAIGQVDTITVPILEDNDGQLGAISDDELNIVGMCTGTLVADVNHCFGVSFQLDEEVAVGDTVFARISMVMFTG